MLSPIIGFGPGKGRLFTPSVSKQYLSERSLAEIPHLEEKTHLLSGWLARLQGTSATEASLETAFISQVFEGILEYRTFPVAGDSHASLYLKPPSKVTGIGRTPDGIIGAFAEEHFETQAILELELAPCGGQLWTRDSSCGYVPPFVVEGRSAGCSARKRARLVQSA